VIGSSFVGWILISNHPQAPPPPSEAGWPALLQKFGLGSGCTKPSALLRYNSCNQKFYLLCQTHLCVSTSPSRADLWLNLPACILSLPIYWAMYFWIANAPFPKQILPSKHWCRLYWVTLRTDKNAVPSHSSALCPEVPGTSTYPGKLRWLVTYDKTD
jgi:hypothetical protein